MLYRQGVTTHGSSEGGGAGEGGGVGKLGTAPLHQCLRSLPPGGTRQPAAARALLCGARHAVQDFAEPAAAQLGLTAAQAAAHTALGGSVRTPRSGFPLLLAVELTHVLTPVCGSGNGQ